MTPFVSTITSPVFGQFFRNPICVQLELAVWKVTLQRLYSKIHAGWRDNLTPRYPPRASLAAVLQQSQPHLPAPLFPPLTLAWARATTNQLPSPLGAWRLGPGAESAGALLLTLVDAVSSAKQAKLVASSIKSIMSSL